jgi:hypothetical protein
MHTESPQLGCRASARATVVYDGRISVPYDSDLKVMKANRWWPALLFAFSNGIVTSQLVIFSLGVTYPDPSTRGAFRRRSVGGERERHLRAMDLRNLVPGPYSGNLAGH